MIPRELALLLHKHKYSIVGNHSAVKLCTWTRKSLMSRGYCYKQQFYGIESHRCLQCTPSVAWCQHSCIFCWRPVEFSLGTEIANEDEPETIADGMIASQAKLLSGLKPHAEQKKFAEALEPKHVAISLAGEPTIYTRLSGLIDAFHKRGMTTFLVTNGMLPERLKTLKHLPTQLYLSLCSSDEQMYLKTSAPRIHDGWKRLLMSLDVMRTLETRRVIRLTLVKGLNMYKPEKYAQLIARAMPDFVECKAFVSVGFSRDRLPFESMPSFEEIKVFSQELSSTSGYSIVDDKRDSRVVLLSSGNVERLIS